MVEFRVNKFELRVIARPFVVHAEAEQIVSVKQSANRQQHNTVLLLGRLQILSDKSSKHSG